MRPVGEEERGGSGRVFPSALGTFLQALNVFHLVEISGLHYAHPSIPQVGTDGGTFSVSSLETFSSLIPRSRPGGAGQRHVRTSGECEQ